jgi:hypothetical protein
MRVLLDEQLPIGFAADLAGHVVVTVASRGWSGIKNGDLLRRAAGQYEILISMDRGIELQQRTSLRPFGIVRVSARSNRLQHLRPLVPAILAAISGSAPGKLLRVDS